MLSFSADSDSKHLSGFHIAQCKGRERDCSFNDGGVKNQHGVWFIGGRGKTPIGFENLKPEDVKNILVPTCPERSNVSGRGVTAEFLARCVKI